jgi:ABC-type bacteriocin/lantibiotic exporter with double-glycine peptidase domain
MELSPYPSHRNTTIGLLLSLWNYISPRRRTQLALLLLVMLLSALAELVSLGSVLPFLAVITDPDQLWRQSTIAAFAVNLGARQASDLLIPFTLIFVLTSIIAALVRLGNLWLNLHVAASIGSDISCEAYRRTLYQPYNIHVKRNSAAVITATTTHTSSTVGILSVILQVLTAGLVSASLLLGLLLIDWKVAVASTVLFATVYYLLGMTIRHRLEANGDRITMVSSQKLQALQEGLGAIRDVLLDGNQEMYVDVYRKADYPERYLCATNQFLSGFPRYALEALGLVLIAILGCLLVLLKGPGGGVITLLGSLALGAQRLLPALQQLYNGWATLKANTSSLAVVLLMLEQPIGKSSSITAEYKLVKSFRLDSVRYKYGSEQIDVLKGVDLEIRRGERIGLVGTTGSGKSTTVDILMGLLEPTDGRFLVDGFNIHDPQHPERLAAWRSCVAHVPQSIYLADSSIAENIAFGVPLNEIDMGLVIKSARQAQISGFIESRPDGYKSFVGERGIRLSGGQRQRIGIARALYKRASVLIFDEATSALDFTTEKALMEAIDSLDHTLTIVMVTHRLTTLNSCDRVFEICDGRVKFNLHKK